MKLNKFKKMKNSRNCCVKSKTNFVMGEKSFILLKIKEKSNMIIKLIRIKNDLLKKIEKIFKI